MFKGSLYKIVSARKTLPVFQPGQFSETSSVPPKKGNTLYE